MTTAADLASRLRALPAEDLVVLVVGRRLPGGALAANGPAAITDFFDLADALRGPDSIDRALERLPRATLLALRDPTRTDDLGPALALGLATSDPATGTPQVDDAVAERLAARTDLHRALDDGPAPRLPSDRPTEADPRSGGATRVPDAPTDPQAVARATGVAAERAFTTMTTLAELLRQVDDGVVHELAKGGIGAPLGRQLAAVSGAGPEDVGPLLDVLAMVGHVDTVDQTWSATDEGRSWLVRSWPDRWADLVAHWQGALPDPVRGVLALAGDDWSDLAALGRWAYPGGAEWLDSDLDRAADVADRLGLVVDQIVTPTGRALLDADPRRAVAAASADLPPTVDAVYLQHDLTVIAPGPLTPADDQRLRRVADVEAPGLATRYRISEESIRRALLAGIDRAEILDTLSGLSATALPQPVGYLVDQVAARAGSIVVDRAAGGVGTVVRGPADQLDLIGVDAELRHFTWDRLALDSLGTRYPPTVVAAELEAQRYPAVVAAGARPPRPTTDAPRRAAVRTPESQARDLVERLRVTTERGDREPEQEWLGRQIDLAVRGKVPIRVTVQMPDGSQVPFTIVPTSVAAGRVRGRDTHADVERTLPLSLVVAVESEA
ncbi:helicase-associated domain-containing protein [Curtobacterium sp. RRHDQ10]|uniref:helicase-associated domain-containing protein n=1 Tax=Curtobacterium phyllosphaerae TaxID=3413379 RepID=UPI003BF29BEB